MSVDQMLQVLTGSVPGITWGIRESEYDDRYVLGRTRDGTKLRIVSYGDHFSSEVYFWESTMPVSDGDKLRFMQFLEEGILPVIDARNIRDEG